MLMVSGILSVVGIRIRLDWGTHVN